MHSPADVVTLTVTILAIGVIRSATMAWSVEPSASALTKSRSDMMPTTEPSIALLTISTPIRFSLRILAQAWTVALSST